MKTVLLMAAAFIVLSVCPVMAADITWDGDTSTDFTNVNNWVGGVVPVEGQDRAIFPATITPYQPALMKDRGITGIVFQSTTGGWTLGGSGRRISVPTAYGAANTYSYIDDSLNTGGTDTIEPDIYTYNHTVFLVGLGGNLRLNGKIVLDAANQDFTVHGGTATVSRLADPGKRGISLLGTGTWVIVNAAESSFSNGLVQLSACRFIIGNRYALGYADKFRFNKTTNSMLAASVDLTGANKITNNVWLDTDAGVSKAAGVYGNNNIEFGGKLYTSSGGSDYFFTNGMAAGKKLIVNEFCMNDNTANKSFNLYGAGDTEFNGLIYSGVATPNNNRLSISSTGLTSLNHSNAFIGPIELNSGIVRLGDSNAVPWGIQTGGGTNVINFWGGILELGVEDFTRSPGVGPTMTNVAFKSGGGGFSAYGAKRRVNLGGAFTNFTWAVGDFVPSGSALKLNSSRADSEIEFQNPINLNNGVRTIEVADNAATNTDFATLSGVVTNGGLVKTGAGKLVLAATTNYFASGLTVSNGTLTVQGAATSSVMNVYGGTAVINGPYTGPVSAYSGGGVGGTGTVASLTLNSNAVLQVTILDTAGHSDALTVSSLLNVTNITLSVVNTNLLTLGQTYRVVTCPAGYTNTFAGSNLPARWMIDYSNSGYIQLRAQAYPGTMIKIQ